MAITFKHKIKRQAIFYNDLIPGRSTPGPDGTMGENGTNGPSIYFSDYTPDNDYVKKILLDKISQGLFLTSYSSQKLVGISYTPGDLIITEKKYVYKLILVNGEYDLKFLGQFSRKTPLSENENRMNLIDGIVGVEMYSLEKRLQPVPVPTNRGMESSTNISTMILCFSGDTGSEESTDASHGINVSYKYKDCLTEAFGFDFFPIIKVDSQKIKDDYDFYLKIKIKNEKSIQAGAYTLDEYVLRPISDTSLEEDDPTQSSLHNIFVFYKTSELKLKSYTINETLPSDTSSYITEDNFARCSITEMTCDKLHPSGNGINSNIVDSNYIYREEQNQINPGAINDTAVKNTNYISSSSSFYGKPGSVRKYGDSSIDVYSADSSLFLSTYTKTVGFLQYPRRQGKNDINYTLVPNFRGGDSAFFSGITQGYYSRPQFAGTNSRYNSYYNATIVNSDSSYYNFANHVNCMIHPFIGDSPAYHNNDELRLNYEQNYVVYNWMIPFYFNKNNIYELICVSNKTGETYTIPLKTIKT